MHLLPSKQQQAKKNNCIGQSFFYHVGSLTFLTLQKIRSSHSLKSVTKYYGQYGRFIIPCAYSFNISIQTSNIGQKSFYLLFILIIYLLSNRYYHSVSHVMTNLIVIIQLYLQIPNRQYRPYNRCQPGTHWQSF